MYNNRTVLVRFTILYILLNVVVQSLPVYVSTYHSVTYENSRHCNTHRTTEKWHLFNDSTANCTLFTCYITKLSVSSVIVFGVPESLFSTGLPHINNSLFCFSTVPSGNLWKNTVALTLNLMNTLYIGKLISNLTPCLFDIFRINIKYVGQLLSKL